MLVVRFRHAAACWALVALCTIAAAAAPLGGQGIPDRLSDAEFWKMFNGFSETDGYFQSENLLSNETGFLTVIPELVKTVKPGGVYVGVGPEQNFTYIAALHPRMAFIVDIRHQNAVHHLLYKALIELSENRADFLSRLFSRPRPAAATANMSIDSLFALYASVPHDSVLFYKTMDAVKERLMTFHGFELTKDDQQWLLHNFDAFYNAGPELNYSYGTNNFNGNRGMPTYSSLMQATDNAGIRRSYLAADSSYQVLRDLELRNLIVPVTGNFAGPKALRAVADYVRKQNATITTFYTSNAEQYLFQNGIWFDFEANVATFPLDATSVFIRSGRPGNTGYGGGGRGFGGGMATSLLQSMMELVKATNEKRITGYQDVLNTSH